MKHDLFLLFTVFLVIMKPVFAFPIMSDKEFFDSLNLSYPGIEAVKTALISADTALAKTKLLEYYQDRTSVHYFDLLVGGDVSGANDNLNRYFTVNGVRLFAGKSDGSIDWKTSYS